MCRGTGMATSALLLRYHTFASPAARPRRARACRRSTARPGGGSRSARQVLQPRVRLENRGNGLRGRLANRRRLLRVRGVALEVRQRLRVADRGERIHQRFPHGVFLHAERDDEGIDRRGADLRHARSM